LPNLANLGHFLPPFANLTDTLPIPWRHPAEGVFTLIGVSAVTNIGLCQPERFRPVAARKKKSRASPPKTRPSKPGSTPARKPLSVRDAIQTFATKTEVLCRESGVNATEPSFLCRVTRLSDISSAHAQTDFRTGTGRHRRCREAASGRHGRRWHSCRPPVHTPAADQARFIDTIEVELRGLHEGNIARYRLRPSEFTKWKSDQPK